MSQSIISVLRTLNQLLTAGIAITAFSLLIYALSFNLRDRVTRSFAMILACVVIVSVGDALSSVASTREMRELWLRLEWIGIAFLPAAYLHFSDAVLTTTGRPSRGRRRLAVRLSYLVSLGFLATLPFSLLVGPLINAAKPAPHLQRTWLTDVFSFYYLLLSAIAWVNLVRAYRRTLTTASRRRMGYLLVGSLAPTLGSYPYLLFGSDFARQHTLIFWFTAVAGNVVVSFLLILMAYAVAFFGVPWPDRVVKRRLAKWILRGPVTASTVLAVTTIARRIGERYGMPYNAAVPFLMVGTLLILQHLITLTAPLWERILLIGNDRKDIERLQAIEERLLTRGDIRQFLEAILAAMCDLLQTDQAFIVTLAPTGMETLVTIGRVDYFEKEDLAAQILTQIQLNHGDSYFAWGDFWLFPLYSQSTEAEQLLGLMGAKCPKDERLDTEQAQALQILSQRAALILEDRLLQSQLFSSLEAFSPQMEWLQRLRALARYNSGASLTAAEEVDQVLLPSESMARWVKEALTHYWGGPRLSRNPLIKLRVVQQALNEHGDNPTNALRAILRRAIDQVKPEGERRFTAEWILYNILEMKFMEGKSVREVAKRLALSEADLYRKQRVAIEEVARAILEMEKQVATEEQNSSDQLTFSSDQ
ncbi:MAG: histidine kinase N-terminal 7TM domain-containing protein [Anaerolineales bacterium]